MSWKQTGVPDPLKEYSIHFPKLDGGLNTWELDSRLKINESPELVNMWWKDGALCSRDGQVYASSEELGSGFSAYDGLFHDLSFFHIGDKLYWAEVKDMEVGEGELELHELTDGVPENSGVWFRYGEALYYKNRGGFYQISAFEKESINAKVFIVGSVPDRAYVPTILMGADPSTGAGDEYQSENRLSAKKTVWYSTVSGVKVYQLPVQSIDSVDKVLVDEVELTEGEGYTVDLEAGTVTFAEEPEHHEPVRVNTVKITFSKENPDALNSIMDCGCAAVYGGGRDACIVLGGCEAQPNAYFWSGYHTAMDPTYFPMEQYNLAGDAQDTITGFGKQQNMLVIFKERSIGRAAFDTQELANGRVMLTMDYTAINATIGCDLPGSIQLIENNLVFASTRHGICVVRDSSSAYENNITPISRKVDNGLLPLLKKRISVPNAGVQLAPWDRAVRVCSHDDGSHYWLAAETGEVYLWDYSLSSYSDPVWFYFENINAISFFAAGRKMLHLDSMGRITAMHRNYRDYDGPIYKKYRFATQSMGGYERLKDVQRVILSVSGETDTFIRLTYRTDHDEREDLTPVRSSPAQFTTVALRKPMCRHIRHFSMTLENNEIGTDMAVISAQVFYRYQGRDK